MAAAHRPQSPSDAELLAERRYEQKSAPVFAQRLGLQLREVQIARSFVENVKGRRAIAELELDFDRAGSVAHDVPHELAKNDFRCVTFVG